MAFGQITGRFSFRSETGPRLGLGPDRFPFSALPYFPTNLVISGVCVPTDYTRGMCAIDTLQYLFQLRHASSLGRAA